MKDLNSKKQDDIEHKGNNYIKNDLAIRNNPNNEQVVLYKIKYFYTEINIITTVKEDLVES